MNKKYNNIATWISWFFIKKMKVSILTIVFIILAGLFSVYNIPKESVPDIKFWVIWITTVYQWASPEDIDNLITETIETEIKDIEGIKKITSISSVWISSINVELYNGVKTNDVIVDIQNAIDKINFPEDAEKPKITELSSRNELLFQVLLYGDANKFSYFDLAQKARIIQNQFEGKNNITDIIIWWDASWILWSSSWIDDYKIKVLLDKSKIEELWFSPSQIANIIRSFNKNTPIWNYRIQDLNYDFRFEWEYKDIEELKNTIIRSDGTSQLLLKDIASFKKEYDNEPITSLGFYGQSWNNYITLVFNKKPWSSVFQTSSKVKEKLNELISTNPSFEWLNIKYVMDLSEDIKDDYASLWTTAIQTLLLVFWIIFLFIWFRESIIASLILPLAFFITFIVLNLLWYTLNFLTNFSLILTLWIAIDAIVVIIEWATDKMRLWYSKTPAILLAIKDFKAPLISWTLTTLVAFLPLIFLPWIMGKFLSYIPITVFITLLAVLFLTLTISSALFLAIAKDRKTFHKDPKLEENLRENEIQFLKDERKGKKELKDSKISLREKLFLSLESFYYNTLAKFLKNRLTRTLTIITPIILLVLSFKFLSPQIGFTLFPATDNARVSLTIKAKVWTDKKALEQYIPQVEDKIKDIKELKVFYIKAQDEKITVSLELTPANERQSLWQKDVFTIEKLLDERMDEFRQMWFEVNVKAVKNWPSSGPSIWIKLIADSTKQLDTLKQVSKEFEEYLKSIEWTKNVWTTSSKTPWQFIFDVKKDKLTSLGLTPDDIIRSLYSYIWWTKAWSIKSTYEDNDIVVQIWAFEEKFSPSDLESISINTKAWKIKLQDVVTYKFVEWISSVNREDGKITISVQSDFVPWTLPSSIQPKLQKFAENYNYPEGISFQAGWENAENEDLIVSTISSFFIAVFLIFSILVFQFNSFKQPFIVLYSIVLALLWVNVWLYLTWNPYSMPFAIWFIALTWIVVNNAIILIDKTNNNIDKWINLLHAVLNAWKSRLQPILVTTLTTISWILPLALQDQFWAGLWFTIVFGLAVGALMTLFVIPTIYYSMYKKEY